MTEIRAALETAIQRAGRARGLESVHSEAAAELAEYLADLIADPSPNGNRDDSKALVLCSELASELAAEYSAARGPRPRNPDAHGDWCRYSYGCTEPDACPVRLAERLGAKQ
jgi:hypothetical protein